MKIGIIVESLRCPLETGIARARELGAEGIQVYALSPGLDMLNDSPDKLKKLRETAENNGLVFSAVCSDLGGHGFSDPPGNPERSVMSGSITYSQRCSSRATAGGACRADA